MGRREQLETLLIRDAVMKLLSDEEVAMVSTAETAATLTVGEEYLDLTNLDDGVRRAVGGPLPMGHVLPRKAVQPTTWKKLVSELEFRRESGGF